MTIKRGSLAQKVGQAVTNAPSIADRIAHAKQIADNNPIAKGVEGASPSVNPENVASVVIRNDQDDGSLITASIDLIDENPFNARAVYRPERISELATSIAAHGQDVPGIATMRDGRYLLVAGHYRLKAIRLAGHKSMKLMLRNNLSDQDLYACSYRENREREAQSAYDDALAWRALLDKNVYPDQKTIAAVTGNSTTTVNKTLRLLDLSRPVLDAVAEAPDKFAMSALYELVLFEEVVSEKLETVESDKDRDRYAAMSLEFVRKLREGQIGRDEIQNARIALDMKKPRAKKQTSRPYVIQKEGVKGTFKTWDSGRLLLDIVVPEGEGREAIIMDIKNRFGIVG